MRRFLPPIENGVRTIEWLRVQFIDVFYPLGIHCEKLCNWTVHVWVSVCNTEFEDTLQVTIFA